MTKNKNLLVVGGTGRNVGKTEFICQLIEVVSSDHPVYTLKISAVYPDEELFCGNHAPGNAEQHLSEELNVSGTKDTCRMLRAGAQKAFYLRSSDENVLEGYRMFQKHIPEGLIVICESNSLGQLIEPALSVIIKSSKLPIKSRALPLLERADLIVTSDGVSGFPELKAIEYLKGFGWRLK